MVVSLDGTITPASDDLIGEAIREAESNNADALVVELNTPGGGLDETLEIIRQIERTKLPVIGYVAPTGANAWSAGTLILISSDLAAMAPGTIIGSAQPVRLLPTGLTEPVNDTKTKNAIIALIEEKARMHNRNVTAAREFVSSNLNLNAETAKEYGVVEYVSPSLKELLRSADGRAAKNLTIRTANATVSLFEPDPRMKVLLILSDPMIAGLLMLVGLYALIFGISNPGQGAEVFGVIAVALGLIGQGFDVNLGALFLIVLGMGLIIAELHAHSFGVLGVAGIICIIAGTALMAPVSFPEWYLPEAEQRSVLGLFILPSVLIGAFFAFATFKIAQARLRPTFAEETGKTAEVIEALQPKGYVIYRGEYWQAEADETVAKGETVEVLDSSGQVLKVRRKRQ